MSTHDLPRDDTPPADPGRPTGRVDDTPPGPGADPHYDLEQDRLEHDRSAGEVPLVHDPAKPAVPPPTPRPSPVEPDVAASTREVLPLEGERTVRAGDPCPNCAATLPTDDALVCLRCGYDLRENTVRRTHVAAPPSADDDGDEDADDVAGPVPVLARRGKTGVTVPVILIIASLTLVLIGYLTGASGLVVVSADGVAASAAERLAMFVRHLTSIALWSVSGLGGLIVLAWLTGAKVGDAGVATARIAAMFAVIGLVKFLHLSHHGVEIGLEHIMQIALFVGAAMMVFRLSLRDAATLAATIAVIQLGMIALGLMTAWAWGIA